MCCSWPTLRTLWKVRTRRLGTARAPKPKGLDAERAEWNAHLTTVGRQKHWQVALALAEEMQTRLQISWDKFTFSALISACSSSSVPGAALALLEAMPRAQVPPNAFALGAAAAACVRGQWWHQALELVTVEMQQLKLKQTTVTYGTAVNACSVAAWWEKSLALLDNLQTERLSASVILCNSVIRSCERAGRWLEALQLLKATPERDVVGFSSALQACAKAAQWAMALAVFDQIPRAGLRQNLHATTGAIIAAGHTDPDKATVKVYTGFLHFDCSAPLVRTRMFQRMLPVSEHVSCPCSGDRPSRYWCNSWIGARNPTWLATT
ncbi:Pentatricopeptide repeat-containing protein At5g41170 [Durusdinium trenchii]|uniref:Mitochondrial n=1 Tax=Durusdinium trenchii TaxID=1381693 RepID=A0ABP0HEX0_9DINO